jgi:hypothetical protein
MRRIRRGHRSRGDGLLLDEIDHLRPWRWIVESRLPLKIRCDELFGKRDFTHGHFSGTGLSSTGGPP